MRRDDVLSVVVKPATFALISPPAPDVASRAKRLPSATSSSMPPWVTRTMVASVIGPEAVSRTLPRSDWTSRPPLKPSMTTSSPAVRTSPPFSSDSAFKPPCVTRTSTGPAMRSRATSSKPASA